MGLFSAVPPLVLPPAYGSQGQRSLHNTRAMSGYWSTMANSVMVEPEAEVVPVKHGVHGAAKAQDPDSDCVIVSVGQSKQLIIDASLDLEAQIKANFDRSVFKNPEPRLMLLRQVHSRELKNRGEHIWKSILVDLKNSAGFLNLNRRVS